MLETLLKPIQSQENDEGIDCNWIRGHGNKVEDNLLPGIQGVDIDGIEAALGGGAACEEQCINVV